MITLLGFVFLLAILAVIFVLIRKHGFKQAWGMIVALLVAIAAALGAFWDQLNTPSVPLV